MFQLPLDIKQSGLGIFKKEKISYQLQHSPGDFEPDDYDDIEDDSILMHRVKVSYISNDTPRFDSNGRQIKRGSDYGIQFVNYITVCLFDTTEEVGQIKRNLEEFQTQKVQNKYHSKAMTKSETQITLYSLLKKK